MSKKKELKSNNWRINYQDKIEYYESQQAAIVAANLIISSCESGIWCGKSYFFLSHQEGDAVDRDLREHPTFYFFLVHKPYVLE